MFLNSTKKNWFNCYKIYFHFWDKYQAFLTHTTTHCQLSRGWTEYEYFKKYSEQFFASKIEKNIFIARVGSVFSLIFFTEGGFNIFYNGISHIRGGLKWKLNLSQNFDQLTSGLGLLLLTGGSNRLMMYGPRYIL